jgi:hypothetical protein
MPEHGPKNESAAHFFARMQENDDPRNGLALWPFVDAVLWRRREVFHGR